MQAESAATVKNLQAMAASLAHLAGQYQVDVRQLKAIDLDWLAKRVKEWYKESECHLRLVIDRILYFEEDPAYNAGPVEGFEDAQSFLDRSKGLVTDALKLAKKSRVAAYVDEGGDYTTDIYEHIVRDLEKIALKISRELFLMKKLGPAGYTGARLEDGD